MEMPYFTAEFLNLWMKENNDDIFMAIFSDLEGTAMNTPANMEFFRRIKKELPNTIFHGTDIGHQYLTTGARFLQFLQQNRMQSTEKYRLAKEAIEQGRRFYNDPGDNHSLRADMMLENFIREFDNLDGASVMSAFYGSAHVSLGNYPAYLGGGATMASRLRERYGPMVNATNLHLNMLQNLVGIPDRIQVGGKEYAAMYFGEQDLRAWSNNFLMREFWRLENAYDDFRNNPLSGEVLPFNNYPMLVETGQVFAIRFTLWDGSTEMGYYRAGGRVWRNMDVTEEFLVE